MGHTLSWFSIKDEEGLMERNLSVELNIFQLDMSLLALILLEVFGRIYNSQ